MVIKIYDKKRLPTVSPNVGSQSTPSALSLGEGTAQGLQQLSRGLGHLQARFEERERERDELETLGQVQAMKTDFQKYFNDPQSGVFNTRLGMNAYNTANDSAEYMSKYIDDKLPKLRNDRQRAHFGRLAFGVQQGYLDTASNFEAREHKNAATAVSKAAIDSALADVAGDPENIDNFTSAFEVGSDAIRTQLRGQAESVINNAIENYKGELVKAQIGALIVRDIDKAIAAFDEIKEKIPGDVRVAIEAKLKPAVEQRFVYDKAGEYMSSFGEDEEAAYNTIMNDEGLDIEQREKVWRLFKSKRDTLDNFKKKNESEYWKSVKDAIYNSTTPEEAEKIAQASGYSGEKLAQVRSIAAQVFKPGKFVENPYTRAKAYEDVAGGKYTTIEEFLNEWEGRISPAYRNTLMGLFFKNQGKIAKSQFVGTGIVPFLNVAREEIGIKKGTDEDALFLTSFYSLKNEKEQALKRELIPTEISALLYNLKKQVTLGISNVQMREYKARIPRSLGFDNYDKEHNVFYKTLEDGEKISFDFRAFMNGEYTTGLQGTVVDRDNSRPVQEMVENGRPVSSGQMYEAARDGGVRLHKGIDIAAKAGSNIRSADFGTPLTVKKVGHASVEGHHVVMGGELPDGRKIDVWIMHMADGIPVKTGDIVEAGSDIGKVGANPGSTSTGSHMHLQIKIDGQYVNPDEYLKKVKKNVKKEPTAQNLSPSVIAAGLSKANEPEPDPVDTMSAE